MAQSKYDITVTRTVTEVYRVDARSSTEAAAKLGSVLYADEPTEKADVAKIHQATVSLRMSRASKADIATPMLDGIVGGGV